jgi:HSP20 family protein
MAVVRWDPLREVVSLQSRLNSLFQNYGPADYGRGQDGEEALAAAAFAPPVDIYEDENKLVLKLEVPGVRPEDIDIQVENRTLTVRGERKFTNEEKQENFHRVEQRYGTFARSFTLPSTVDPETVKANYDAGVLTMELAKKAEAKPRQIKIGIGSSSGQRQVESGKPATGTVQSGAGQSTGMQSGSGQGGSQSTGSQTSSSQTGTSHSTAA